MKKYPEHEKLEKVKDQSQAVGEFLEWLRGTDRAICQWQDGVTDAGRIANAFSFSDQDLSEEPNKGWFPVHDPIEKTLAEYFDIDLNKLEKEKRQMLEEIRKPNENRKI